MTVSMLDEMIDEKLMLLEALEWYAEKVRDCRKVTREGDETRHDLDRDGGERARLALECIPRNSIFNDEEAMDLIRLLQDNGYEADEVYNAMKEMSS